MPSEGYASIICCSRSGTGRTVRYRILDSIRESLSESERSEDSRLELLLIRRQHANLYVVRAEKIGKLFSQGHAAEAIKVISVDLATKCSICYPVLDR